MTRSLCGRFTKRRPKLLGHANARSALLALRCIVLCAALGILARVAHGIDLDFDGSAKRILGEHAVLIPAGSDSSLIANLSSGILIVGSALLIAVLATLGGILLRGIVRDDDKRRVSSRAQRRLVIAGGVVLPGVVIIALVVSGLFVGREIAGANRPTDLTIEVLARQWWWEIHYLDESGERIATTANEIHVPVGRDVRVLLRSPDVIHSFWVPSLHGKMDMIPGRTHAIHLNATRAGVYRGLCAEFCGTQHALMAFLVVAESVPRFEDWLAEQRRPAAAADAPETQRGAEVFRTSGCAGCHAIRGTPARGSAGPDLTHLASRKTLGAATLPNTRGHLGGWIADPQALKPGNLMPSVPLEPADFHALLAYLEQLR